jgi:hypothetical protein
VKRVEKAVTVAYQCRKSIWIIQDQRKTSIPATINIAIRGFRMIVSLLDRLISNCSVLALCSSLLLMLLLWVAVVAMMVMSVMVLDGALLWFHLKRLNRTRARALNRRLHSPFEVRTFIFS